MSWNVIELLTVKPRPLKCCPFLKENARKKLLANIRPVLPTGLQDLLNGLPTCLKV